MLRRQRVVAALASEEDPLKSGDIGVGALFGKVGGDDEGVDEVYPFTFSFSVAALIVKCMAGASVAGVGGTERGNNINGGSLAAPDAKRRRLTSRHDSIPILTP